MFSYKIIKIWNLMKWNVEFPIKYLPEKITRIFSNEAAYLLEDLEKNKLEVVLIPAPQPKFEGHMIRVAINSNSHWYKQLYHSKNHVKRQRCINALERIAENQDRKFQISPYLYDCRMREIILDKLYSGMNYDGLVSPGDPGIITFFDKGIITPEDFENLYSMQELKKAGLWAEPGAKAPF